ncbi:MAG: rRNA maturation RNase YbeY [Leptospiraceae bacterium]|nr:rRNA maturation RNase YbeY [Leptospiraceae bacterium]MDW8307465.1 rRNA maturation RNase YbeY [Leptospiraceae bacterium]
MPFFFHNETKNRKATLFAQQLEEQFSRFAKRIRDILARMSAQPFTLRETTNIIFTGKSKIKHLNLRYRGQNEVTDVLTFPGERGKSQHYADIFICYPKALHQAKFYHNQPEEELLLLSIHGLVHAAGLDHEIPEQKELFCEIEEKLVALLNFRSNLGLTTRSESSHNNKRSFAQ